MLQTIITLLGFLCFFFGCQVFLTALTLCQPSNGIKRIGIGVGLLNLFFGIIIFVFCVYVYSGIGSSSFEDQALVEKLLKEEGANP